ncbi:hypothetical protein EQV77_09205 [Halobacillus fulvus]|nr:hypothetical protein EQV77_09205 [Halobacillus fulvus]
MKKAKGYYRRRVQLLGGGLKEARTVRTFRPLSNHKVSLPISLMDLNMDDEDDRCEAIKTFGSVEGFYKWRRAKQKAIDEKRLEKKRRQEEGAYDIPTYKKYDLPSPTYTIGEDGIARQREDKL